MAIFNIVGPGATYLKSPKKRDSFLSAKQCHCRKKQLYRTKG